MPKIWFTILPDWKLINYADLSVNIPGRKLDDDGNVLVRFKGSEGHYIRIPGIK